MFIALRVNATASSVGAACSNVDWSHTEIHSAPTERTKYLVATRYKHFVPTGLRREQSCSKNKKARPLLQETAQRRTEKEQDPNALG